MSRLNSIPVDVAWVVCRMAENHCALLWYAPHSRLVGWKHIRALKFGPGRISDARGIYSHWWYDPEVKEPIVKPVRNTSIKLTVPPVDITFWTHWEKRGDLRQ